MRFSTEDMPRQQGWNTWSEIFSPVFKIDCDGDPGRFQARVDAFDCQRMMLTKIEFGGVKQRGSRSKELIRRSGLDHFGIEFCLSGDRYTCEGRHGPVNIHAGTLAVLDLAQPNTLTAETSASIALTIPRNLLEAYCPDIERLHGARVDTPGRARLLGEHMQTLYHRLPHMTAEEAQLVVEATAALVGACLVPSADRIERVRRVIDHNLLDRARRYIAIHLENPKLSPDAVCTATSTSRSTLYRLFQPLGGVAHYIREARLRRIHAALRNPAEWRSISSLAYCHGFESAAHCSRAFRELFGYSPRDIRDLTRSQIRVSPGTEPSPANVITDWLKGLQLE